MHPKDEDKPSFHLRLASTTEVVSQVFAEREISQKEEAQWKIGVGQIAGHLSQLTFHSGSALRSRHECDRSSIHLGKTGVRLRHIFEEGKERLRFC